MSRRHAKGERAVSLLEVIVVMLIIGVLLALASSMFIGAKRTSRQQQAGATARVYAGAAIDFAVDNGGSVPAPGGPGSDWPRGQAERGPVDKLQKTTSQRYLRRVPDAVASGVRVVLAPRPPAGARTAITYQATSALTFRITAWVDGVARCVVTNEATPPARLRAC